MNDTDPADWAVLAVTPLMKRAQEISASGEIIFIDSTSSVESEDNTVTLMLTATKAGAVPIGVLMHAKQSTEAYTKGFKLMQEHYPNAFGGKEVSIMVRINGILKY